MAGDTLALLCPLANKPRSVEGPITFEKKVSSSPVRGCWSFWQPHLPLYRVPMGVKTWNSRKQHTSVDFRHQTSQYQVTKMQPSPCLNLLTQGYTS
jgi:hypothetical protein